MSEKAYRVTLPSGKTWKVFYSGPGWYGGGEKEGCYIIWRLPFGSVDWATSAKKYWDLDFFEFFATEEEFFRYFESRGTMEPEKEFRVKEPC